MATTIEGGAGSRFCTFRLTRQTFSALLSEAARRTIETGTSHSIGTVVRDAVTRLLASTPPASPALAVQPVANSLMKEAGL